MCVITRRIASHIVAIQLFFMPRVELSTRSLKSLNQAHYDARAMRFIHLLLCALVFVTTLSACSDDEPSLVVELVTGIVPIAQFARVHVNVIADHGEHGETLIEHRQFDVRADQDYAHGFRIADFASIQPGQRIIQVILTKADDSLVIERNTRVTITGNFVLRVHMTPNCIGVMCPSPAGNAGFSECLDGHCVDPRCNPPAREFCGDVVFCDGIGDCAATSSCAESTCIDGICDAASIEGACSAIEWCDPLFGAGCEPLPVDDAGVADDSGLDGGMLDASDAGSACGSTCLDEENVCRFGVIDCSEEAPFCNATLPRTGTPCGAGSVCDVNGECVLCAEGGECQVGCALGHLTCTSGIAQCLIESGAPRLDVGSMCETPCGTASICPTPHVCSSSGECIECFDDAPCTIGCERGRISCASGGICVLDNTHVAPFTPCGAAHICDGRGECVTCVDGAPYEDGCYGGTITACSTAAPSAASRSLLGATSSCGEVDVCSGDGYGCYRPYRATAIVPMGLDPDNAMGTHATCAVLPDQTVQCWGSNNTGGIGWGRVESPPLHSKVDVVGLTDVVQLTSGWGFYCARTEDGEVWCWGRNRSGELGNGTYMRSLSPVHTILPQPALDIAAGGSHACAILEDHTVFCWGAIYVAGDSYFEYASTPHVMAGIEGAVKLAHFRTGEGACVLLDDGHIKCFGIGYGGAFGDGEMRDWFSGGAEENPVDVLGIDDAIDLGHDGVVGCAVRANHEVWCWGSSYSPMVPPGLFGDEAGTANAYSPIHADLISSESPYPVEVIVAGRAYVRLSDGSVLNFGSGIEPQPARAPLDRVRSVAQGYTHSCAITGEGNAVCWGSNSDGAAELGSGHGVPSSVIDPVAVMGEEP